MKKTLTISVAVLFFLAVLVLGKVFSGSMSPSERAKAARSQHDISKIAKGTYLLEEFQRKNPWSDKVLIIKDWDESLYVHIVPAEGTAIVMPEPYWGWGYYNCKDFRPDLNNDGTIAKSGRIRCHDKDAPEWMVSNEWIWKYSGKSEGQWTHDMYSPKFEVKNNTVYING